MYEAKQLFIIGEDRPRTAILTWNDMSGMVIRLDDTVIDGPPDYCRIVVDHDSTTRLEAFIKEILFEELFGFVKCDGNFHPFYFGKYKGSVSRVNGKEANLQIIGISLFVYAQDNSKPNRLSLPRGHPVMVAATAV